MRRTAAGLGCIILLTAWTSACDRDEATSKPSASSERKKVTTSKPDAGGQPASSGGAAETEPSGEWSYATSNQKVKGACPKGGNTEGKLKLTSTAAGYQLVFITGRACSPAEMCTFQGKLDGKELSLKNGGAVDDEGGTASNTLDLTVASPKKMTGKGTSRYEHPGGMTCDWTDDVVVER